MNEIYKNTDTLTTHYTALLWFGMTMSVSLWDEKHIMLLEIGWENLMKRRQDV